MEDGHEQEEEEQQQQRDSSFSAKLESLTNHAQALADLFEQSARTSSSSMSFLRSLVAQVVVPTDGGEAHVLGPGLNSGLATQVEKGQEEQQQEGQSVIEAPSRQENARTFSPATSNVTMARTPSVSALRSCLKNGRRRRRSATASLGPSSPSSCCPSRPSSGQRQSSLSLLFLAHPGSVVQPARVQDLVGGGSFPASKNHNRTSPLHISPPSFPEDESHLAVLSAFQIAPVDIEGQDGGRRLLKLYQEECRRLAQEGEELVEEWRLRKKTKEHESEGRWPQQQGDEGKEVVEGTDRPPSLEDLLQQLWAAVASTMVENERAEDSNKEEDYSTGDQSDDGDDAAAAAAAAGDNDEEEQEIEKEIPKDQPHQQDLPSPSLSSLSAGAAAPFDLIGAGRRVLTTRFEVILDFEKEKDKTGLQPGGRYIVRVTSVEAEDMKDKGEENIETEDEGEAGLIQRNYLPVHRVRVVRKTKSCFKALHQMLANLVSPPSPFSSSPVLALPGLPELDDSTARAPRLPQSSSDAFVSFMGIESSLEQQEMAHCQRLGEYLNRLVHLIKGGNSSSYSSQQQAMVTALRTFLRTSSTVSAVVDDLVIHFHTKPSLDVTTATRDELLVRQQGKCRGCGARLVKKTFWDKNFMTCRYVGALFCKMHCSEGPQEKSILPGDLLQGQGSEGRRRRVCHIAGIFLEEVMAKPTFSLSPSCYRYFPSEKAQQLKYAQHLRQQLYLLTHSIQPDCSAARRLLDTASLLQSRPYFAEDNTAVFSMQDLLELQTGTLTDALTALVEELDEHGSVAMVEKEKYYTLINFGEYLSVKAVTPSFTLNACELDYKDKERGCSHVVLSVMPRGRQKTPVK